VYSLTVTLFSLLLGTGLGAAWSRHLPDRSLRRMACWDLTTIALAAVAIVALLSPLIAWAIPFARSVRVAVAGATLVPLGILLGVPMPSGLRMLSARAPEMVAWAWGINGALSVVGATLAIFVAMNWGFGVTLLAAAGSYLVALTALLITP
jgi:hypothetical protein